MTFDLPVQASAHMPDDDELLLCAHLPAHHPLMRDRETRIRAIQQQHRATAAVFPVIVPNFRPRPQLVAPPTIRLGDTPYMPVLIEEDETITTAIHRQDVDHRQQHVVVRLPQRTPPPSLTARKSALRRRPASPVRNEEASMLMEFSDASHRPPLPRRVSFADYDEVLIVPSPVISSTVTSAPPSEWQSKKKRRASYSSSSDDEDYQPPQAIEDADFAPPTAKRTCPIKRTRTYGKLGSPSFTSPLAKLIKRDMPGAASPSRTSLPMVKKEANNHPSPVANTALAGIVAPSPTIVNKHDLNGIFTLALRDDDPVKRHPAMMCHPSLLAAAQVDRIILTDTPLMMVPPVLPTQRIAVKVDINAYYARYGQPSSHGRVHWSDDLSNVAPRTSGSRQPSSMDVAVLEMDDVSIMTSEDDKRYTIHWPACHQPEPHKIRRVESVSLVISPTSEVVFYFYDGSSDKMVNMWAYRAMPMIATFLSQSMPSEVYATTLTNWQPFNDGNLLNIKSLIMGDVLGLIDNPSGGASGDRKTQVKSFVENMHVPRNWRLTLTIPSIGM